jgi:hypothetical protein
MSRAFWLDVLRHGLQVLVFCCLIAVFTTLIWPQAGYGAQLVYSVSIGLLIWAVIEFGRLLVPAEHCHRDPSRPGHGWPKGWRGVLLTVAGIGLGYRRQPAGRGAAGRDRGLPGARPGDRAGDRHRRRPRRQLLLLHARAPGRSAGPSPPPSATRRRRG